MLAVVVKRIASALPALFGVSLVMFILLNVLPGDPLAGLLSENATQADRDNLARELGLDGPLPAQYVRWLGDMLQGDLGYSFSRRRPVAELVGVAFRNTLVLSVAAAAIGLTFGIGLGTLAALNSRRRLDRVISVLAMTGLSVPSYWLAIILIIIFSAQLQLLPAAGMQGPKGGALDLLAHLIMPALATSIVTIGLTARMTRASLLERFSDDSVLMLRAKGLGRWQILWHVAKNAAPPIMTVAGLQVGYLLGGSVLVETIFSWPGLGQLIFQAITARDLRLIQAAVLVISVTFVLINLAIDLLQTVVNPQLRRAV